jgi:hypothetical protein
MPFAGRHTVTALYREGLHAVHEGSDINRRERAQSLRNMSLRHYAGAAAGALVGIANTWNALKYGGGWYPAEVAFDTLFTLGWAGSGYFQGRLANYLEKNEFSDAYSMGRGSNGEPRSYNLTPTWTELAVNRLGSLAFAGTAFHALTGLAGNPQPFS